MGPGNFGQGNWAEPREAEGARVEWVYQSLVMRSHTARVRGAHRAGRVSEARAGRVQVRLNGVRSRTLVRYWSSGLVDLKDESSQSDEAGSDETDQIRGGQVRSSGQGARVGSEPRAR